MYKRILLTGLLVGLAACSNDRAPAAAGDGAAARQPASEAPAGGSATATATATGFAYTPFPGGLQIATPFHVRNDRFYTTKSGNLRRHSTVELLEGDVAAAAADVKEHAQASGYRIARVKDRGDGITRFALARKGESRILVSISPDVGKRPKNPAAAVVLGLDWAPDNAPVGGTPADAAEKDAGTAG